MLPPLPDLPDTQRATGTFPVRYEDIAQDGRLLLEATTTALGAGVWNPLIARHALTPYMRAEGIVPILTRIVIEGTAGPFAVQGRLTAHGAFELAHARGANGDVERIFLNMWADVTAPIGRTHGPPPERAGEMVTAGRIFAEHVFTRLFAPPGERKVTRFDAAGVEALPPKAQATRALPAILELPPGAVPLGDAIRVDTTPVVFGITHTDSNQHVNSLVYPRLFEDAALRRFASLGKSSAVLARSIEIGFRKPCFAGETMRIALRAYALGDKLGAYGVFVTEKDAASESALASARPHAFVHTVFEV
jgi:acyl-CoA thioesterase FadM